MKVIFVFSVSRQAAVKLNHHIVWSIYRLKGKEKKRKDYANKVSPVCVN